MQSDNSHWPIKHAPKEIDCKNNLTRHHADSTIRHERVKRLQVVKRFVMVCICQPSRKTNRPQNMHRKKGAVQEYKREEEVHLAPELIHCSSEHFWKPEVNGSPNTHCRSRKKNVMEMSHNEIRVMDENINRSRRHKNPG